MFFAEQRIISLTLADGSVDLVTREVSGAFMAAFMKQDSVLIVEIDGNGEVVAEKRVPLCRQ